MTQGSNFDLDSCAAEPIRIPGAIQPHGALLVLDPGALSVLQVSTNLKAFTGLDLDLGASLDAGEGAGALHKEIDRWRRSGDPTLLRIVECPVGRLQLRGHMTAQGLLVEFEEPPRSDDQTLEGMYQRLGQFLDQLAGAQDLSAIAAVAVAEVRFLTRFNRVLLYSFDEKGDGTVLAQDSDGTLPSYLGLRFPASDIPRQARDLYVMNRIRLIADVDYVPVSVTPAQSPLDGQPIDLSQAGLRSVSPVHLEYMRNMGTGSSMSISIVVNGQLWGLISGHSRTPHYVNTQIRAACDMLGQVLSLQIDTLHQAQRTSKQLDLKRVEADLLSRIADVPAFQRGLRLNADTWMSLTNAQGAAVVTGGQVLSVGSAPPDECIRDIVAILSTRTDDLYATDCLSEVLPEAKDYAGAASGMIAVSISQIHADYVMWFRPEVVRIVEWSGDPAKPMQPSKDRLHPRKSFELWKEQVQLRSLPWREEEIESARSFRASIHSLVLRRAEERAEMTERLQRVNKELEAFSYSISHDLRAPFRHIVGYAELLADREKELDATSKHYLTTIKDSAVSAGRLVDDLLHFSQLGRTQLNVTAVDMDKLVSEVRRSLDQEIVGRNVEWQISRLPPASADAGLLRQVVQNLIENALKYTRPRETARISFSAEVLPNAVSYTISDNGVGFEMQYVAKLFGVFQRLHRVEDFEGTGIGLALVKRILDRHGGTITAVGKPGEGASFTFTLPQPPIFKGVDHRG